MPHADSPPATPTPEGLAAALALIDAEADALQRLSYTRAESPMGVTVALAVITVARTAICYDLAGKKFTASGYQDPGAVFRARDHHVAAVARLCALATGAQAGEGAGGS